MEIAVEYTAVVPSPAMSVRHLTSEELQSGLDEIRRSPKRQGRLEMIVRRPAVGAREVLPEGRLDLAVGLVGDTWEKRGSTRTPDGSRHPDMQINLMNARAVALIARDRARWPLAGDQLFVDLDLTRSEGGPRTMVMSAATRGVGSAAADGCCVATG